MNEKKEWEYSAEERQHAVDLMEFMKQYMPTCYQFYLDYKQHQATLVPGVETVDGISEAFPAKRDTPST